MASADNSQQHRSAGGRQGERLGAGGLLRVSSSVQNMGFGPKGARSLAGQLWVSGGHARMYDGDDSDADAEQRREQEREDAEQGRNRRVRGGAADKADDAEHVLKDDEPYAELWMGATHVKGPSRLHDQPGVLLKDVLYDTVGSDSSASDCKKSSDGNATAAALSSSIGSTTLSRMPYLAHDVHGGMPFIFKVLSAGTALPLQAHPAAHRAQALMQADTEQPAQKQAGSDNDKRGDGEGDARAHPLTGGKASASTGTVEAPELTLVDGVHKPEIALAITPFRGFIGFAAPRRIADRLRAAEDASPKVRALVEGKQAGDALAGKLQEDAGGAGGEEGAGKPHVASSASDEAAGAWAAVVQLGTALPPSEQQNEQQRAAWTRALARLSTRLLAADKHAVREAVQELLERSASYRNGSGAGAGAAGAGLERDDEAETDVGAAFALVRELHEQFPGDAGCLYAPLLMNCAHLAPGQCIFAPADTVHAWLSGDIIECMPSSVNVTNAAFGPEPDAATLELFGSQLTYASKPESDFHLVPQRLHGPFPSAGTEEGQSSARSNAPVGRGVYRYRVPLEEFDILRVELAPGDEAALFTGEDGDETRSLEDGVAVLSCIEGSGVVEERAGSSGGTKQAQHQHQQQQELHAGTVHVALRGTSFTLKANNEKLVALIAVCQH